MPGWRGLLRAALALLLAPVPITLLVTLTILPAAGFVGADSILHTAGQVYGLLLLVTVAGVLPATGALLALHQLRAGRLILWSAALSGLLAFGWIAWRLSVTGTPPGWPLVFQSALGVVVGLANAAVFVLIAAVSRWPAATLPRPSSSAAGGRWPGAAGRNSRRSRRRPAGGPPRG